MKTNSDVHLCKRSHQSRSQDYSFCLQTYYRYARVLWWILYYLSYKVGYKGTCLNDGGIVQCFQLVKYYRVFTSQSRCIYRIKNPNLIFTGKKVNQN